MTSSATSAKLRDLLAAATPGRWHWTRREGDEPWNGKDRADGHSLIFDELLGEKTVLGGAWCNDSTADVAVDQGAADAKLIAAAPALARLVLTLSEEMRCLSAPWHYHPEVPITRYADWVPESSGTSEYCGPCKALAAVEELEL